MMFLTIWYAVYGGASVATTSAKFQTEEACRAAGIAVVNMNEQKSVSAVFVCVPTGSDPLIHR